MNVTEKILYDLFNKEQGKFFYYTVGLTVIMIGYIANLLLETNENLLIFPLTSLLILGFSLYTGIYAIRYRVSNYYNQWGIHQKYKEFDNHPTIVDGGIKQMEENDKGQNS